jgi:uncharacterized protein (DUF1810 family)
MTDPYLLQRFIDAQDTALTHVLAELRAGQKTTHWMWYVFPQLKGLGHSPMAQHYGIASLADAKAYLAHPLLGPRLLNCTRLVNQISGRSLHDIFGSPDDMKFRSSMTLFARAAEGPSEFRMAIEKYCGGREDVRTTGMLSTEGFSIRRR